MKLRLEIPSAASRVAIAFFALILAMTLSIPATATTPRAGEMGRYRGQCRKLTRQIRHFEADILPLAVARGNRTWESATNAQINRLWHRRADLCPAYAAERTLLATAMEKIRRFNQTIAMAGRAAAAYFTGGLSGGIGP